MTGLVRARYTLEFKEEAVRLVLEGQTVSSMAKTLIFRIRRCITGSRQKRREARGAPDRQCEQLRRLAAASCHDWRERPPHGGAGYPAIEWIGASEAKGESVMPLAIGSLASPRY